MKSVSEIRSDLQTIADNYNMEGASVDALINLLTKAIYDNELCATNIVLESSLSRSQMINSRITCAGDLGYSVFRGRNKRIVFKNLTYVGSKETSVKKMDELTAFGTYHLLYANDYTFHPITVSSDADTSGSSAVIKRLECLIAKNVYTYTQTLSDSNKMIAYFPVSDVSGDIVVRLNGVQIPTLEGLFADKIASNTIDESAFKLHIITMAGYGVFIVNPAIGTSNAFKPGDSLEITYIEYLDQDVDVSSIKSIPGFNYGVSLQYETIPLELRESDGDLIYTNALMNFRESYTVRANDDLENIIKDYFAEYISGLNVYKHYFTKKYFTVSVPARKYSLVEKTCELDDPMDSSSNTHIVDPVDSIYDNQGVLIGYVIGRADGQSSNYKFIYTDSKGNNYAAIFDELPTTYGSDPFDVEFTVSGLNYKGMIHNYNTSSPEFIIYKPYKDILDQKHYNDIPGGTLTIEYYTSNPPRNSSGLPTTSPVTKSFSIPANSSYVYMNSLSSEVYIKSGDPASPKIHWTSLTTGTTVDLETDRFGNFTIPPDDPGTTDIFNASIDVYTGNIHIQSSVTTDITRRVYSELVPGTLSLLYTIDDQSTTFTIGVPSKIDKNDGTGESSWSPGDEPTGHNRFDPGQDPVTESIPYQFKSTNRITYFNTDTACFEETYNGVQISGYNFINIPMGDEMKVWILGISCLNTIDEKSGSVWNNVFDENSYVGDYTYTYGGLEPSKSKYKLNVTNTLTVTGYYTKKIHGESEAPDIPETISDARSMYGNDVSIEGFRLFSKLSYYLGSVDFKFLPAVKYVYDSSAAEGERGYPLYITINHSYLYDSSSISDSVNALLNAYRHKIGEEFDIYKLLSGIQSIEGVIYVNINNGLGIIPETKIILNPNQYMDFNSSYITYNPVKYNSAK